MSYRHSSYRAFKKICRQAEASPEKDFWTRVQRERARVWFGWKPEPKPADWGVPRSKRRAA